MKRKNRERKGRQNDTMAEAKKEVKVCELCDKECGVAEVVSIVSQFVKGTYCSVCFEECYAPFQKKLVECRKKKLEQESQEERWARAPRKSSWNTMYCGNDGGKGEELPFHTKKVNVSELKKGDIIAETKAWEMGDTVILGKVKSINKKTISVVCCDQDGRLIITGNGHWNYKIHLYEDYPYTIVA
jgi:hypothetical protein